MLIQFEKPLTIPQAAQMYLDAVRQLDESESVLADFDEQNIPQERELQDLVKLYCHALRREVDEVVTKHGVPIEVSYPGSGSVVADSRSSLEIKQELDKFHYLHERAIETREALQSDLDVALQAFWIYQDMFLHLMGESGKFFQASEAEYYARRVVNGFL